MRRSWAWQKSGKLPILMPLRKIGRFLQQADESADGHVLLLEFLQRTLQSERIDVPLDFFDPYLQSGNAVILLDGMDEVAGSDLRRRVARLVEAFTRAYPRLPLRRDQSHCRLQWRGPTG